MVAGHAELASSARAAQGQNQRVTWVAVEAAVATADWGS
jgi:hypothetical protein